MPLSFTQPCCNNCWQEMNPGRPPVRLQIDLDDEVCCYCGNHTKSGIYVRVNPNTVKYPTIMKAESK